MSPNNIPASVRVAEASNGVATCHPSCSVDTVSKPRNVIDGFVIQWGDDWSRELRSLVDYSNTLSVEEHEVEEIVRRFPKGTRHPGLSGIQSAELSIDGMMGFMDRVEIGRAHV